MSKNIIHDENYYRTRFKFDPGRAKVWRAITQYLQRFIGQDKVVFDLGCGYGDFINEIQAVKKYALDINPLVKNHLADGIKLIATPSTAIKGIPKKSVDAVFSSNLLEHLSYEQIDETMTKVRQILKDNGVLILIGPNFTYSYKNYFDDYTHRTIFTHVSLPHLMQQYGFEPVKVMPKFLPLTLKSRLPKSYWLTQAYLHSPIKPMGKQMLIILKAKN